MLTNKEMRLFLGLIGPLFEASIIFEAAGTVAKYFSSLKPNHHK